MRILVEEDKRVVYVALVMVNGVASLEVKRNDPEINLGKV